MMKVIAVLPARYASTRFPAKLMQDLCGQPVIVRTYEAVVATRLFDEVWVATDHQQIAEVVQGAGGRVFLSQRLHESGSDRIAEAVANLSADVVINVQGDEPFIQASVLRDLIDVFKNDSAQKVDLASAMFEITNTEHISNSNHVKVVVDDFNRALYFSRASIPFARDGVSFVRYFQHIGVYAFRKQALMDFATWEVHPIENTEKLEQLRYLAHGKYIQMVETSRPSIGIDTPEDLERARIWWTTHQL